MEWVCALKFSPDGQTLASGSADETVRLWDVPTRRSTRVFRGHHQQVRRVCFSPDGGTLFVNIYTPGITLAITGPWGALKA